MASDIALPARTEDSKARVFISYSRKDMAFADRLEVALKGRGFEPLIDRTDIYAFEDWWKRIEALIGRADTVVFVLSPDAVKSDVALKEVAYAASLNKRFAPIVCSRVDDNAVPEPLRRLNFIFFDDRERFNDAINRLAEALHTDIGWIRQHTEYGEAERHWSAAGRPLGLLLHSPALEVAEFWIASHPRDAPEPTADIRTFISASRQNADAAQRRRRLTRASIYALLIGIIVGLVGWINQEYLKDQWHWYSVTRPYAKANVWNHVLTTAQEQTLKPGDTFRECAHDCPEMVVVPAGSFVMGSPPTEKDREPNEGPQHRVTIARPFAVAKFELTFGEWDACVSGGGCGGYEPQDLWYGPGQRGRIPVFNVTWDDAQRYVRWLSSVTGKSYRLLSEAEHEYATRAGTSTVFPWGNAPKTNETAMANCDGCGSKWDAHDPAPVGSFASNAFGLHDMVGNVTEWVEDCYHKNFEGAPTDGSGWTKNSDCTAHVARGGSYAFPARFIRSADRTRTANAMSLPALGFRVARTLLTP